MSYKLVNYTRKQVCLPDRFSGNWEYTLKTIGWDASDRVIAFGVFGDIIFNDLMPSSVPTQRSFVLNPEGVWKMCCYAAKRLEIDPIDFYNEFVENSEEPSDDFEILDYDELKQRSYSYYDAH